MIKGLFQQIVGLGLGKYVNLGMLLAFVVAAGAAYAYVTQTNREVAALEREVGALTAANASLGAALTVARKNYDAEVKVLADAYAAMADDKISAERAARAIREFSDRVRGGHRGDEKALEDELNAWQSDLNDCVAAASGGPPIKPNNGVCG